MALDAILDTQFYFSYFSPDDEKVGTWAKSLIARVRSGRLRLASSVITRTELLSTMGRIIGEDATRNRISAIQGEGIPFLDIREGEADLAGEFAMRNPDIPVADCLIAATSVMQAKGVIVSRDAHFSKLTGIRVKWLKAI